MEKILIIDDDGDIRNMLKNYLGKEGYKIYTAKNGEEGIKLFKSFEISIVLIDIMMPKINGYDTLCKLREISQVPVIMITAKGQQSDKVLGFIKGCDDYLVKPFDLTELSFRIRAILRRTNITDEKDNDKIYINDLEIIVDEFTVLKNGQRLKLTKKEFEILVLLASNKGKVFSPNVIYETLWNDSYIENDNSVLTHIRNLREKIGDRAKNSKYIKTIWGVGYSIEKDT
ncbi:response regulator transcription factor [Clostridium sporogenes]|uniref:response regulator transcription factor n=1 Tax=Clostridium sporogenes TaxID=1509 RepID=UPI00223762A8|nr:response regulator transcription factor [Clostridium sporogenes]EKS4345334.1 response regulator transcription factor [Clostridium botulinum]EKS4393984.1 response regulator transcription factor [Clostridium botulinum]MCW6078555.1 response regulator transcription factor [Clostridium sporogenes]